VKAIHEYGTPLTDEMGARARSGNMDESDLFSHARDLERKLKRMEDRFYELRAQSKEDMIVMNERLIARDETIMRLGIKGSESIRERNAAQTRENILTEALGDIANMPKIDQDDEHRLRHKAKVALEAWRASL
jgi:hypothetical protein